MPDLCILKVQDAPDPPEEGAWAWGGPALSATTGSPSVISKHPLQYISPESGFGVLFADIYSIEPFYITSDTFDILATNFGTIGGP